MKIIFKPVVGYEGLYEVSNDGVIKSLAKEYPVTILGVTKNRKVKERILKTCNSTGYVLIALSKQGKKMTSIHRLVAMAFIPNPENYPCINHKDGNKLNNLVENLEWCTYLQNNVHSIKAGLTTPRKGTKIIMDNNGDKIHFRSMGEANKKIGISNATIIRSLLTESPVSQGKFQGVKFKLA